MIRKTTLSIIYKLLFVLLMSIQLHAKIATVNPTRTSFGIPTTITPDSNNILYINKNVSGGNNSGDSWTNAIPELADALKYAKEQDNYTSSTPLKMFVAGGTYTPLYSPEDGVNFGSNQNRDNSFLIVKNVQIYGGFAGVEATLANRDLSIIANKSILSGDIGTVNNNSDNTYHVVVSSGDVESALLNGFTIADGYASNTFNTLITINSLGLDRALGAGIYNLSSSPTISNITFINNIANVGGAVYNKYSLSKFTNVQISNNPSSGGTLYNDNSSPTFINATIVNNVIYNSNHIRNTNSFPVFTNCIIFDKTNGYISNESGSIPVYKYSLVQGLNDNSNGNIKSGKIAISDIFTDPTNKDYTLALYSPAINTGDNTSYTNAGENSQNDKDIAGNKRVYNGFPTTDKIDLGGIEYQGETITPNGDNIIFVDNTITGGDKSGSSWTNAINELADVLKYAKNQDNYTSSNPLKVFVAGGTYKPMYRQEDQYYSTNNKRRNTFSLVKNVQLYGGFAGTETTLADRNLTITTNKTILSGDIGTVNDKTDNSYHVIMSIGDVETAKIDGFTIRDGYANESSSGTIIDGVSHRNVYGAGIYNYSSSPTLSNLIITDHETAGSGDIGGGIYNNASSPIITDVKITNNKSFFGGGIGNEFASNPTLVNVFISGNTSSNSGGGMYNKASSPKLINVNISGNSSYLGGGIYNYNNSNPTFTNITVSNNTANYGGNGVYNQNNSNPTITNSIIWGNTGGFFASNLYDDGSTSIVTYSLIENTDNTANNGLNGLYSIFTPQYSDAANGDYTLLSSNAVINKGNNTAYTNAIGSLQGDSDLAGVPRIYDGVATNDVIDIGAYEFQGETTLSAEPINPSVGNVLYVNKNANSGNYSGDSWANATKELADALKYAKLEDNYTIADPLKIFVAKGTYKPLYSPEGGERFGTNQARANTFSLVKNVQVYGGFAGIEANLAARDLSLIANKSILSGDIGIVSDRSDNNYHIVVSSGNLETALLNGFTITGGNANHSSSYDVNTNNIGGRTGGGIVITNSSPTLKNISIINNYALDTGGGIYSATNSYPKLTNVVISENEAENNYGGGLANSSSSPTLTNVTITKNKSKKGGGISNYSSTSSPTKIINCIIWGNTATTSDADFYSISSSLSTINFSLVGGIDNTTNNGLDGTDANNAPQFTNGANGDYSLLSTSPVINLGNNAAYTTAGGDLQNDKDVAGNTRVYHTTIDFGAFESQVLKIIPDSNNIIYVNKSVTGSNKNGDSWANAIPELADALKWAKLQTDFTTAAPLKIFVAGGTYKPMYSPEDGTNFGTDQTRNNSFLLVKNVQIYGGFAGTESALTDRDLSIVANKTILSGDLGTVSNNSDNTYHVVISSGDVENALLNGFTISGGNANGTSADIIVNTNSFIKKNGGGLYTISSSPKLTYVTISNNNTSNFGGGVFNNNSNAKFLNCIISENNAEVAVAMYNVNSSPSFTNVSIVNNSNNPYNEYSIYNSNSSPTFNNCIIFNSIISEIRNINGSSPIYKNSLIQNINDSSNGNIKSGTLTISDIFTDVTNGDYSLALYSPAINKGNNTEYTTAGGDLQNDKDIAGNTRIYNGLSSSDSIDLGAIEYEGETITPNGDNIIFVNNSVSGGNKTGNSWTNAVSELADALYYADQQNEYNSSNPLKIFVAKGVYKPKYSPASSKDGSPIEFPDRQKTFLLVKNVEIYGGFAGTETTLAERDFTITANKTTLSGDIGTVNVKTDNSYHVVMSIGDVETAKIDGFTISNGYTDQNYEQVKIKNLYFYNGDGAGIYNSTSSPTLSNLIITDNQTENDNHIGGGIYNNASSPLIRDVKITNNKSYYGGGIGSENNSNPTLLNVAIFKNESTTEGGGMYNIYSSSPKLINVTISENASSYGGGIYNERDSNSKLTNVTVSNNTARDGGGVYNNRSNPTITNTIIWGNTARTDGNNLYNDSNSTPIITYSFIKNLDNTANNGLSGLYSFIFPQFTDATNGDYTLSSLNAAINKGDNTAYNDAIGSLQGDKDLAGNPRIYDGVASNDVIDIGAYEFQGESTFTAEPINPSTDNILYVNKNITSGNKSGDSWANATPELADALIYAKLKDNYTTANPLKIFVAKGTYNPLYSALDGARFGTNQLRNNTFLLVKNVKIYGGFAGTETTLADRDLSLVANKSILSGDIGILNDTSDNSHHVVSSVGDVENAILNGFTITGGYANEENGYYYLNSVLVSGGSGGGITIYNSSPTLINVSIINNYAKYSGGGVYATSNTYPFSSYPKLTNVVISENESEFSYGGGMDFNISSPILTNVTITKNKSKNAGGIRYYSYSYTPSIKITNSIIWGNTATDSDNDFYNFNSSPSTINYSLIGGIDNSTNNGLDGTNASNAPQFTDAANGDYTLKNTSPAVNTGSNTLYTDAGGSLTDKDLAGKTRVYNGSPTADLIDMGAYELQKNPFKLAPTTTYPTQVYVGNDKTLANLQISGTAIKWYDAATAGSALATTTNLVDGTTYYAEQTIDEIESTERLAITVKRISDANQNKSKGNTVADLVSTPTTGKTAKWYTIATGGTALNSTDILSKSTYYVEQYSTESVSNRVAVTVDLPPSVSTLSPADDATAITTTSNLVITFDENIAKGTGNIIIYDASDDSVVETIAVTATNVTITNAIATINPTSNLEKSKTYYAKIAATAFKNGAGNAFVGILDKTSWSFATELKTTPTVTFADFTKTYGDANFTLGASSNSTGTVSYEILTGGTGSASLSGTNNKTVTLGNTGTVSIKATIAADTNYLEASKTITLTISKATITGVTFDDASSVFDGTSKSLAIAGTLPTGTSVSYANNSRTNVGTQEVTATISGTDYTTLVLKADLTITKAIITGVTFDDASSIFDGTSKLLAIAGTLPTGTSVSYANNSRTNVGTQEVTATISGDNYSTLELKADLTITKAIITGVTFDDASSVFDGTSKSLAIAGTLPTGTSVSYANNSRTNVGTQEVTATISGDNYSTLELKADLTITKAIITVIADVKSKEYNVADPSLTYSLSPSLIGTDVFTGNLTRVIGNNVGTYTITQGNLSAGSNYEINFVGNTFEITPKEISVTADASQNKVYGETNPTLTYTASEVLATGNEFTGSLTRANGEIVGTYAITKGSLSAGSNYEINFVGNTFEITKANQTITWTQTSELGCDERTTALLTATSNSGLAVSYSSSNTNVATISNNVAQFSNYGSTMITASQVGNDNYNAAPAVSLSIVNSQPNLIRTYFDNLIFFDNSSNSFKAYSWYKNGVLVPGQTAQYFKDSQALNGTYYAIATKIDGSLITTCPLIISTSVEQEYLKIVPNPVRSNSNYQLITNVELANLQNASVVIYNMVGAQISTKIVNEKTIQMTAPSVEGIYIVRMTLTNGKILTKNLLVKNY